MQQSLRLAEKIAGVLIERGDTIAIAESSTGGLISAALLSVAGASAYFRGGAVIYTHYARAGFLGISMPIGGMRARDRSLFVLARATVRERLGATWGLSETGATRADRQPLRRRGGSHLHAVAGPIARAITLETGSADRRANMDAFARRALELFFEVISAK